MKIKSHLFLDCSSFRLKPFLKWAQDRLNSFLCNDPSFEVDGQNYLGPIYRHISSSNCLQTARYLVKSSDDTWEVMLRKDTNCNRKIVIYILNTMISVITFKMLLNYRLLIMTDRGLWDCSLWIANMVLQKIVTIHGEYGATAVVDVVKKATKILKFKYSVVSKKAL